MNGDGSNGHASAKDEKDIGDIRTVDVSKRENGIASERGKERDEKFRGTGPKADNGKTDNKGWDMEALGEGDCAIYEDVCTFG
jgi:hypothetical protein